MDIESIFTTTVSSAGLLAVVGFLARNILVTRLKASVAHEFDSRLEALRSEFRAAEADLQAQLRGKQAEIDSIRSGAISALGQRRVNLDNRKMTAIEDLWKAVYSLARSKVIAENISLIDLNKLAEARERDPSVQQVFDTLGNGYEPSDREHALAVKARPFVSRLAWALYQAYSAICTLGVLRWQMASQGITDSGIVTSEKTVEFVVAVLPEKEQLLREQGERVFVSLLEEIETLLLLEFEEMLSGKASDLASIEHAAEIVEHTKSLTESITAAAEKANLIG